MFELKMPKLGESVTEGTIGKWLKRPGDKVNKYDLLVEVQTDKVNTEIPSPVSGTLKEVKVEEGQTVPIGTLLAVFDTADEAAAASPAAAEASAKRAEPAQQQPQQQQQQTQPQRVATATAQPAAQPSSRPSEGNGHGDWSDIRATPAVRKLASDNDVDIAQIHGTGLGG